MSLDLSSLSIVDSTEPMTRKGSSNAGRHAIVNPFGPVILDSWNKTSDESVVGMTKIIGPVENDERSGRSGQPKNVTTIIGLLRRAAEEEGLGIKLVVTECNSKGETMETEGTHSLIRFAAKQKTERSRKTDEAVEETHADVLDDQKVTRKGRGKVA